jgi:uncharacterized Rmd1/YagE family protein
METQTALHTLLAIHSKQTIDLKALKSKIGTTVLSISTTDLFLQPQPTQYVLICHYGVLAFYNFDEEEVEDFFEQHDLKGYNNIEKAFTDEYEIAALPGKLTTDFSQITLPELSPEALRIVMLNVAQSVALNYFDHVSQNLLSKVRSFSADLEQNGRLSIKSAEMMRFVGRTLNTQNKIAEYLYIFDAPPDTWEDEYLERIHIALSRHLELSSRYRSIDNTLKIIQANLTAFMELSHHKESNRLEWIIILLILVEVIDTMVAKAW